MCFILTNLHKNENIYSQIMLRQRFLTDTSFVHFVEDGTKIKISTYSDLATFNVKIFYIMKNISVMKNLPRRRFLLYWCHLLSFWYAGPKAVKLAKIQHKLFWKLPWFSSQVVFRTILRPCLYVQLFFWVKMKICDHVCADWRCPLYFSSLSQARWKIWFTRPLLATRLDIS